MVVFKNGNGHIKEIRAGHFEITRFTEIGSMTWEMRHASLDEAKYELQ